MSLVESCNSEDRGQQATWRKNFSFKQDLPLLGDIGESHHTESVANRRRIEHLQEQAPILRTTSVEKQLGKVESHSSAHFFSFRYFLKFPFFGDTFCTYSLETNLLWKYILKSITNNHSVPWPCLLSSYLIFYLFIPCFLAATTQGSLCLSLLSWFNVYCIFSACQAQF
jgi:hypothetical protein